MKNTVFYFLFLASLPLFSQTETTEITPLNDDSLVIVTNTYNETGFLTQTTYEAYSNEEFGNMLVNINFDKGAQIAEKERQVIEIQRGINTRKKYIIDSLGVDYDSIANIKMLTILEGDWTLLRGSGGTVENIEVTIIQHPSFNHLLRMNLAGGGGYNIRYKNSQQWELRGYQVAGQNEVVDMTLTQFQNGQSGYVGRASDGMLFRVKR